MNQLHLLVTLFFSLILGANTFSYKDAKNWGMEYPKCNGKHQSPIIIELNYNRVPIWSYPNISQTMKLTDFHKEPTKITIENTGYTVEMRADWTGEPPSVSGGPLPDGKYVFEKATFRWGKTSGGEHKVYESGTKKILPEDMEMHLYFYKAEFKSFDRAQSQKNGLAVFVKWIKVVGKYDFEGDRGLTVEYEQSLGKLEKNLKKVENINSTAEIPPFSLTSFVYGDLTDKKWIFYEGSLVHPPCSESVTWFIDQDETVMTESLLKEFRRIKLAEGDVSNMRPTQPLNNREVKIVHYK